VTSLALKIRARSAESSSSGTKREIRFLDFVVDGRSLFDALIARGHDMTSCLTLDPFGAEARERLVLRQPGDLPSGRVSLYVCAECGDLGCGCISVAVERIAGSIVWRDFGYENNYEPEFKPLIGIGPFHFSSVHYSTLLNDLFVSG
jgi:hypothetical protein